MARGGPFGRASKRAGAARVPAQVFRQTLLCHADVKLDFTFAPSWWRICDRFAGRTARLRAADTGRVVNMRLESMPLGERPRQVLRLLDGRHPRSEIVEETRSWGPEAIADAKTAEEAAEQTLRAFARLALLVG